MNNIPPIQEIDLLHSQVCQALGDAKRIQILYALMDGEYQVNVLATKLQTPQSTLSRHLSILRERHLIVAKRDGTSIFYAIADYRIMKILEMMRQMMRDLVAEQSKRLI